MKCPNCSGRLKPVALRKHYQGIVVVDQCENCGGTWFDPMEYWKIDEEEAKKIDPIQNEILNKLVEISDEQFCPKDSTKFRKFKDPSIPNIIDIEQCPTCGGFWFNKGEYRKYQEHKRKVRKVKISPEISATVENIFKPYSKKAQYEALYNFSKYLMEDYYKV